MGSWLGGPVAGADWIARWSFERPVERVARSAVRDPDGTSGGVLLPPGAQLGPGRFGLALWPGLSRGPNREAPVLRVDGDGATSTRLDNPADLRLNLGAHDWTLACWLRLDAGADDEGVIFELGSGPPGPDDFVTRWSVIPRENAVVFRGIVRVNPGEPEPVGPRMEFNDPAGPPHGDAYVESVTLPAQGALPREHWFHLALVHVQEDRALRLYLDGRAVATAPARFSALPRGPRSYLALGCDARRGRVLTGAIDELRVSGDARYRENFLPSGPDGTPVAP